MTLVMPSQTPGKETSGDTESVILPDSASLGDDLHLNRKIFLLFKFSLFLFFHYHSSFHIDFEKTFF